MSRASGKVGVLTLSDASETTDHNHVSKTEGNLDIKARFIPKLLMGFCLGQMVILVAAAAALAVIVSDNVSRNYWAVSFNNYIHIREYRADLT